MTVQSLGWLGVRTDNAEAMCIFYRDVLQRVESFAATRAAMLQAGIEFSYPEPERQGGLAWQHFRAPDGNVSEIIGPDDIDSYQSA